MRIDKQDYVKNLKHLIIYLKDSQKPSKILLLSLKIMRIKIIKRMIKTVKMNLHSNRTANLKNL